MQQNQAFLDAFEKHSDELLRHARMRLPDQERALDLVQDCFLRTWDFLVKGGEIRQYRPFLYRTLNNLIIDEYRKHKTQSLDAMLENEETFVAVEGALLRDETDLFEKAAVQFESAEVLKLVAQLPENYRVVVIMRYIDGLLPAEIAECLNESENTISVRIHRGIRKLRELAASSPIQPL